jgi:hypothetical protein
VRNNPKRLGGVSRRAPRSGDAMSAKVAIVAGGGGPLVTRRYGPSPPAASRSWRSTGARARWVTSPRTSGGQADATGPAVAARLIDRIAGEVGPP